MTERKSFKLPDVGEGLTEAEIVRWHVAPGDEIEMNQIVVEIETAKAIVELPSPYEGVVAELHVAEGETVDVGVPIISVDVAGEPGAAPAAPPAPEAAALKEDLVPSPAADPGTHIGPETGPDVPAKSPGEPARVPVLVGYGVRPGATKRRPRRRPQPVDEPARRPAGQAARPVADQPTRRAVDRPARGVVALATPPVRKLAKDLGIDLAALSGTGPRGSVTREDVRAAADRTTAAPAAPVAAGTVREQRIPVRGVRRSTAAAVTRSAFTAPHVTEFLQVDATETVELVRRLRELPEFAEVKVSPLLLVARALLVAVRRHPMINARWTDDEIIIPEYVNLGIAVATERGLVVPNIKDAQNLSLPELATALGGLAETARAGRSSLENLTGGTISITNVGVFGVDAGTPILTPGESANLAFGQIRELPWVRRGELAIRRVTTLSLSFDHRVVDGELGSAVLRDVGAMVEDPARMLAWS
ncbi:2-oxo acid dehydrogenase subunit E2 [Actinomadura craniellae]|uniref:Dihydrolipoamide acetyltransferase component of pyruvate dehydrogenase complex n=1 Tax=Actinomadura craniellae TaxID=2231787 RepID=A0A365H3N0_9ACTN|nr:dihydrolipoamide acetyltransferase family protein [Actinomadura craniellae]RAY13628.1 2-oxo acid dehydrogenase subunit E2 [Actinomadura craniellae]